MTASAIGPRERSNSPLSCHLRMQSGCESSRWLQIDSVHSAHSAWRIELAHEQIRRLMKEPVGHMGLFRPFRAVRNVQKDLRALSEMHSWLWSLRYRYAIYQLRRRRDPRHPCRSSSERKALRTKIGRSRSSTMRVRRRCCSTHGRVCDKWYSHRREPLAFGLFPIDQDACVTQTNHSTTILSSWDMYIASSYKPLRVSPST